MPQLRMQATNEELQQKVTSLQAALDARDDLVRILVQISRIVKGVDEINPNADSIKYVAGGVFEAETQSVKTLSYAPPTN